MNIFSLIAASLTGLTPIEIVANIIILIGCILLVCIGLIKTKKNILIAQNAMFIIMSIGYILLGGYAAVISNAISLTRNLFCLKWNLNWPSKITFIVVQFVFTLLTNTLGFIGWLPFIAAGVYTLVLDTKNDVFLKVILVLTQCCWILYDFEVKNYSGFLFDIFTVISTIIGIAMILKTRKSTAK